MRLVSYSSSGEAALHALRDVFMNPPQYLKPGDLVEISIGAVATLSERVVAGWEDERLSA